MRNNELAGVIVPVITPVDNEDRIDEIAYRKIIRRLIDAGIQGLFIGGSAGEGPLFIWKEWVRMMEIAFDETKGKVPLLGGTMDTSTKRIIEKIEILAQIGYANFVVTPTFYIPSKTADAQLRLFGSCREAARGSMEMIVYNIPAAVGSEISVETMCDMAQRGWTKYCKDSSENQEYFKKLVSEGRNVGLQVFQGSEATLADGLLAGACGLVPVCANYEPETFIQTYNAAVRKDIEELMRLDKRVLFLRQLLIKSDPCWLSGIKYAVSTLGIGTGRLVSPLPSASETLKKKIDELRNS